MPALHSSYSCHQWDWCQPKARELDWNGSIRAGGTATHTIGGTGGPSTTSPCFLTFFSPKPNASATLPSVSPGRAYLYIVALVFRFPPRRMVNRARDRPVHFGSPLPGSPRASPSHGRVPPSSRQKPARRRLPSFPPAPPTTSQRSGCRCSWHDEEVDVNEEAEPPSRPPPARDRAR